jgi:hypothetical protein
MTAPQHKAEDFLPSLRMDLTQEQSIATAQVYATLALAQAIEGVGHDIQDALRTTNAELGSIAIALGERI